MATATVQSATTKERVAHATPESTWPKSDFEPPFSNPDTNSKNGYLHGTEVPERRTHGKLGKYSNRIWLQPGSWQVGGAALQPSIEGLRQIHDLTSAAGATYSKVSTSRNDKPSASFAEMTGSPSSCQSTFTSGSFHAKVRSHSG